MKRILEQQEQTVDVRTQVFPGMEDFVAPSGGSNQDTQVPVMPQGVASADTNSLFMDAVSALVNLGYPKNRAEKIVRSCLAAQRSDDTWTLGDVIKHALDLITR